MLIFKGFKYFFGFKWTGNQRATYRLQGDLTFMQLK